MSLRHFTLACRSAACRPPTSGGTGGSTPGKGRTLGPYQKGDWDMTGVVSFGKPGWENSAEPKWVQDHDSLVHDALHRWAADQGDLQRHMDEIRAGSTEVPSSGGAKMIRAQAAALVKEIDEHGRPNDVPLYRGTRRDTSGVTTSWSENRATANKWAKLSGGSVLVKKKGEARGIRMRDYIKSGIDENVEKQWLIL